VASLTHLTAFSARLTSEDGFCRIYRHSFKYGLQPNIQMKQVTLHRCYCSWHRSSRHCD